MTVFFRLTFGLVIEQCALKRDFELFEAGDKTEVGEKGLTLRCVVTRFMDTLIGFNFLVNSGGQKVYVVCPVMFLYLIHHRRPE